jgi:hypothetical protein
MQCFLGLTFSQNYLQCQKIDIYRQRFDDKYSKSNILQMTLLPPFEISQIDEDFVEAISDEIEGHLKGLTSLEEISFNGVDLTNVRKGNIYLRPEIELAFQYCQQSLWDTILEFGGSFEYKKRPTISKGETVTRTFLPIARTINDFDIESAAMAANIEFGEDFNLHTKGISLFESTHGKWLHLKELYSIENYKYDFNEFELMKGNIPALYV